MYSLNKVILVGNVGNNPELKSTESGKKKASFSLATTSSWKNKNGEWVNKTEWHKIAAWGNNATAVEKISKGDSILVEGKSTSYSFKDNNDNNVYIHEVVIERVMLLKHNSKEEAKSSLAELLDSDKKTYNDEDSSIPF